MSGSKILLCVLLLGGLLLAVPPDKQAAFEAALRAQGAQAWAIGEAVAGDGMLRLR